LCRPSIPGVANSTSGNTSVMSASRSVSIVVGGSWRHAWRVCLPDASSQSCKKRCAELEIVTCLPRWSLARVRAPRGHATRATALTPFLGRPLIIGQRPDPAGVAPLPEINLVILRDLRWRRVSLLHSHLRCPNVQAFLCYHSPYSSDVLQPYTCFNHSAMAYGLQ
jgi:hypothetical protein